MNIQQHINAAAIRVVSPNNMAGIEKAMTELKEMGAEFIIVVLPQKGTNHYSK